MRKGKPQAWCLARSRCCVRPTQDKCLSPAMGEVVLNVHYVNGDNCTAFGNMRKFWLSVFNVISDLAIQRPAVSASPGGLLENLHFRKISR